MPRGGIEKTENEKQKNRNADKGAYGFLSGKHIGFELRIETATERTTIIMYIFST